MSMNPEQNNNIPPAYEQPQMEPVQPQTEYVQQQIPPQTEYVQQQMPPQMDFVPQQMQPQMEPVQPPVKKKKKKTGLIIGIVAGVLVLIAAALFFIIPMVQEQARVKVYNRGAASLENGDYVTAYELFSSLGDYADAPEIAAYAEKGIQYVAAKKYMSNEEYDKAKDAFDSLGGFKDSADLSKECARAIAYENGVSLLEGGQYEEAIKAFEASENYENAEELIQQANDLITEANRKAAYESGKALFESGDYEAALEALKSAEGYEDSAALIEQCNVLLMQEQIVAAIEVEEYETALDLLDSEYGQKVEGRDDLIKECQNGLRYIEGNAAFTEQLYYTAYKIFEELGDYRDSKSRMASCIQSTPETSEIYHHPSYTGSTTLEIDPNTDDGSYTYFKIYSVSGGTETLISCVFIRSGDTATVSLPGGTYILKTAYGFGDWFGEKEMFGTEGSYSRLLSSDSGGDQFVLDDNMDYILTLTHAENGNVGSDAETMDTF